MIRNANVWATTCGSRKGSARCIYEMGHGCLHSDGRITWTM